MTKQSTNPPQRSLLALIADDAYALTFQTSGQYRAALLKHDAMERAHHQKAFAWAVFAENGNVIIWSESRDQVEQASTKYKRPVVPVIALSTAQQAAAPGAVHITPQEAAAAGIECGDTECGGCNAGEPWCIHSAPGTPEAPSDPVVEANRQLLLDRSRVGLIKYGKPLEATSLSHAELTQHALEEALDLANYLQAILRKERVAHLDGGQEGSGS
jgi:hypothetical protein